MSAGGNRAVVALAALAATQAAAIYFLFVRGNGAVGWDPAHHSLWGLSIYRDATRGEWITFLFDSYRQIYWPPLQSWLIALSMAIFGPTVEAARLVSVTATAFTTVAVGLLAMRLAGPGGERPAGHRAVRDGALAAAVAAGLWLTAARFARYFAGEAFLEAPAIAATAAALLAIARAERTGSHRAWTLAGLLAMVTYLTKTDYGIIVMIAVVAASAWHAARTGAAFPARKIAAWALPIAILSALWFAYPAKIAVTWQALVNRPQGPAVFSLSGLLYHFEQLRLWSDGTLVFVLLGAALAASLFSPKTLAARTIVAYVIVALVLHSLSRTKDWKHIVKLLPWLTVLAGWQAARFRAWLGTRPGGAALRTVMACAVVFLLLGRAAALLAEPATLEGADLAPLVRDLTARIEPDRSTLIVGEFALLTPYHVPFALMANEPDARIVPDPINTKKAEFRVEAFQKKLAKLMERMPALRWFEKERARRTYRIGHAPNKRSARDTTRPGELLLDLFRQYNPDRILVIGVLRGSPYYPVNVFHHPGRAFLPALEADPLCRETETIRYEDAGVELRVFERRRGSIKGETRQYGTAGHIGISWVSPARDQCTHPRGAQP